MGPLQALRLSLATLFLLNGAAVLGDECQPYTWSLSTLRAGDLNCRLGTTTGSDVDADTCDDIARKYRTTVDSLIELNPGLGQGCKSIKPNTKYCIEGFIEPLRAVDGLCGPDNGNATCVGTDKQCCNSKTWKCGTTEDDCRTNCYEGNCY